MQLIPCHTEQVCKQQGVGKGCQIATKTARHQALVGGCLHHAIVVVLREQLALRNCVSRPAEPPYYEARILVTRISWAPGGCCRDVPAKHSAQPH